MGEKMATKIIVAVHGIGQQFTYGTIQSVAYQFCGLYGVPAGIPLGSFHAKRVGEQGALLLTKSPWPPSFKDLGFAEVYWADIPQGLVKKGNTLEETKAWARTIVERLRLLRCAAPDGLSEQDYAMVKRVLEEMIETIAVLDRLLFLADKAGIFKFDLNTLLVDFMGDVQVVTEFEDARGKILDQFGEVMQKIYNSFKQDAEIHIVAHSEGTVIAFMGLLKAMCDNPTPDWVKQVRGFMTIGSPIDKHMVLWEELWEGYQHPRWQPQPDAPIQWRNYYDNGDPVGFNLERVRDWLKNPDNGERANGKPVWRAFKFDKSDDFGFSRYYLPGKAHVDYWHDEHVFGHFIKTVVKEPLPKPPPWKKSINFDEPPGSKLGPQVISYILPYVGAAALLFVGVYLLYKAVTGFTNPKENEAAWTILANVGGIASLLGGFTVMSTIPRLTRSLPWHLVGLVIFILSAWAYSGWVALEERERLGDIFWTYLDLDPTTGLLALTTVLVVLVYLANRAFPSWGLKPLLVLGGVVVFGIVAYLVWTDPIPQAKGRGPMWPVFLAGAGFLYLWWLAALLFDLAFVWHRYIRHSQAVDQLRKLVKPGQGGGPPTGAVRKMAGDVPRGPVHRSG